MVKVNFQYVNFEYVFYSYDFHFLFLLSYITVATIDHRSDSTWAQNVHHAARAQIYYLEDGNLAITSTSFRCALDKTDHLHGIRKRKNV